MTYSRIHKQEKVIYSDNSLPSSVSQSFPPEAAIAVRSLYYLYYRQMYMCHSANTYSSSYPSHINKEHHIHGLVLFLPNLS